MVLLYHTPFFLSSAAVILTLLTRIVTLLTGRGVHISFFKENAALIEIMNDL
jgi:hypothetical protein